MENTLKDAIKELAGKCNISHCLNGEEQRRKEMIHVIKQVFTILKSILSI